MSELKTYSIQNDIISTSINIEKLDSDIRSSNFIQNFSGISISGDIVSIVGDVLLDEAGLDNLVSVHEAVSLQDLKEIRYIEIDNKTADLILAGFTFDSRMFSMSINAQINWTNFPNLPDGLFPLNIIDLDEGVYSLALANKLNFYLSALNHKNGKLQSGGVLKSQIKACTTKEQVNAIIDNR